MKLHVAVVVCLLVLGAFAGPASATLYTLNDDNCTGGCGGGPFGTVEVTQNGANTVHVVVTLEPDVLGFAVGGNEKLAFWFNIAGSPTIKIPNPPSGWALYNDGVAGQRQIDGYGSFDYGLAATGHGASNPLPSPLIFDVQAPGLTFGMFADLSTEPPNGYESAFFAAHIAVSNTSGQTVTGPVGATGPGSEVPEPATIFLFGSVLLGAGWGVRRRFDSK
ncbi:MAG: PEP-CTERM sorting domain-containing protein [Bryobacteraceae bacterium]